MKRALLIVVLLFSLTNPVYAKTVNVVGKITPKYIESVLRELEPGDTIHVNSRGGDVAAAFKLAQFIRKNDINIHLHSTGLCRSACVLFFACGVKRTAGKRAQFFIHPPIVRETGNPYFALTFWLYYELIECGVSPDIKLLPPTRDDVLIVPYELAGKLNLVNED
ncbi:hypothetical protein CL630_02060 [bacterium]|nr:hypothetical protein [bacterium]|tara:strand:- start:8370 stop:8864 length:495 start_codon:yes stop_codon:yes gene_type:complete